MLIRLTGARAWSLNARIWNGVSYAEWLRYRASAIPLDQRWRFVRNPRIRYDGQPAACEQERDSNGVIPFKTNSEGQLLDRLSGQPITRLPLF